MDVADKNSIACNIHLWLVITIIEEYLLVYLNQCSP